MSKYIDAGLLREKISAQMESIPREKGRGAGTITSKGYGMMEAFQIVRSIIDFLQQEQPSLPDNLDEAAEEYAYNNWEDNDYHTGASEGLPFDAIGHTEKCFKAGVEWMAEQMVMDSFTD